MAGLPIIGAEDGGGLDLGGDIGGIDLDDSATPILKSLELNRKNYTLTLPLQNKYCDRDVIFDISVPRITLENGQTFTLTDTIATWNWTIDSNGNVTID